MTGKDLFGRERELAWLDECWSTGVRVVSIVAWGGVGKSALVNTWLRGMDEAGWRGAERVFGWSFYNQGTDRLSSSDEFVDAALRWFGDEDPSAGSPWDKGERLAALVRRQRTLLVLDGVEPLQWGRGEEGGKHKDPALQMLVKELGAQNKGLCLITTRIEVADLEALGGDKVKGKGLVHLSKEAGAELLKARGAKGAEEELHAASEEYEGHSLALTLLGTYLRRAHKGDLRQRDIIPPLAGEPAQRMMAIYEEWFKDKPELAILRMLGLFDRPAPADEIAAVRRAPAIEGLTDVLAGLPRPAWNEAVTALRDVGLLAGGSETEDAERLDAHPLVREHFGKQLRQEQPEAWREGHRRLYEHLGGKAKPLPVTIEEMAPLFAAVAHGCLAGKRQEALDEVYSPRIQRTGKNLRVERRIRQTSEWYSHTVLGAYSAEREILSSFFEPPWDHLAPGLHEQDHAYVLGSTSYVLQALGLVLEAADLMKRALDAAIGKKDWKNASTAAFNLSEISLARGDLKDALKRARESVEHADKSDAVERLSSRAVLGATLHAMNRRAEASAQFEEAEQIQKHAYPEVPELTSILGFRYQDLLVDLSQGGADEVISRAGRAPKWTDGRLIELGLDHLSLGYAHLRLVPKGGRADLDDATLHIGHAVTRLRLAKHPYFVALGILARAALYTHTHAFRLAREDLEEAHTIAIRSGFRLHACDAHLGLARLSLAEGNATQARDHLAHARKIITITGYHRRDEELATLEAEAAQTDLRPE